MQNAIDIITGLRIPAQFPLDAKTVSLSESILSDLGDNDNLAYTYYDGLVVFCQAEKSRWQWKEANDDLENKLLQNNFQYPANVIVNGINYSGKEYNFYKILKQDNIHIVKYITILRSQQVESPMIKAVKMKYNSQPNFTVNDQQSVSIHVSILELDGSITQTAIYLIVKIGSGNYGAGGTPIEYDNLFFIGYQFVTAQDIENNPDSQIYTIEDLEGMTVSEYINQLDPAVLFQETNIGPRLIKITEVDNEADYLFLPPGGLYGTGELQTVDADFQPFNNEDTGLVTHISQLINDVPYLSSNDEVNLPEDFQMFCTYDKVANNSNRMMYRNHIGYTDRFIDISIYTEENIITTNWVGKIDNTLIVMGKLSASPGNIFVLSLRDCKIIGNVLTPSSHEFRILTEVHTFSGVPFALHSAALHRGFCYFITRTQASNTTVPTQIFKINPYDLTDLTIKELDVAGAYNGSTGTMQAYRNRIYFMVSTSISNGNRFMSLDENLENPEILFTIGLDTMKRVPRDSVFIIYNDEIYIPYINNQATPEANNQIGMFVFDLFTKTLKREIMHTIDVGAIVRPSPHWISEFNGKIIFHTANNVNINKHLIVMDSNTLALEGNGKIALADGGITNNNTVDRQGNIYLNSEFSMNNGYLYKVKYNDVPSVIDVTSADSAIGYYSLGSLEREINKESIISKISRLLNDAGYITEADVLWEEISGSIENKTLKTVVLRHNDTNSKVLRVLALNGTEYFYITGNGDVLGNGNFNVGGILYTPSIQLGGISTIRLGGSGAQFRGAIGDYWEITKKIEELTDQSLNYGPLSLPNKTYVDASQITILTSINITTATTDSTGLKQNGRNTIIDNGSTAINITTATGLNNATYFKKGSGAITFVAGSGRTLMQMDGTAVFDGIVGSTASIIQIGLIDYLYINNR